MAAKKLYCHDDRHETPCLLPCQACEDEECSGSHAALLAAAKAVLAWTIPSGRFNPDSPMFSTSAGRYARELQAAVDAIEQRGGTR